MTTNVSAARALIDDLRPVRPLLYFRDAGWAVASGWGCVIVALATPSFPVALVAALVGAVLLYRALAFIHELFHQQDLTLFRWFWHGVVGIPLLLPLLMYLPVHQPHHSAQAYGTRHDGEYEDFRGRLGLMTSRLLTLNLLLPLALLVRFGLLTPLSLVAPVVRREVIPSFVHLALRMPFRVADAKGRAARESMWVEWLCAGWAWMLVAASTLVQPRVLIVWGLVVVTVAMLNTIRALCSTHLYSEAETGRDAAGQVDDSLNVQGRGVMTWLLCPAGLQFHALHHLAPYLPYHALPAAHQRLMAGLPPSSGYHAATVDSMSAGWRRLAVAAREQTPGPSTHFTAG